MSNNTIKYFMWGYQHHTQISFQCAAESLFNNLDPILDPKVFLIGVLVEERDDRQSICLEPEDCGYSVDVFSNVKELAEELEKVDTERNIFHSHPIAHENHLRRLTNRSYIGALKRILAKKDYEEKRNVYIASPTYIDGYQVYTVLSLNSESQEKYYSLTKEKESFHSRYPIYRSFIESVANMFLRECTNKLIDPVYGFDNVRASEEFLREAGNKMMETPSWAGKSDYGPYGLYYACNQIASMKYEGAVGIGEMIIAKKDHHNIKMVLELKNPIRISDYRLVRKFLELSNNIASVVSDSGLIYGLGTQRGRYNPNEESLFVVKFQDHYKWELLHNQNSLMTVEYKLPGLPKEKIQRAKYYTDLPRIFPAISKNQIDTLWDVSLEATNQKHGTMLVITDNAPEEATRLGEQCFVVKPFQLTSETILQVTSIDGAVLLDRDCTCHAIGVILDGMATPKGNPARGARYNSAIRYYESLRSNGTSLLIVIVSEDGMINLIPDLKPQVEHLQIIKKIEQLNKLFAAETYDHKSFHQLMGFFEKNQFYLTESECDEINALKNTIEVKFKSEQPSVRFIRADLRPNDEMNDSYYLPE